MGNFEKLSVLVIVVIIVMILVVAIHTWTSDPEGPPAAAGDGASSTELVAVNEPSPSGPASKEDKPSSAAKGPIDWDDLMKNIANEKGEPADPKKEEPAATPSKEESEAEAAEDAVDEGPWTYTVKGGDTISQVAERELGTFRRTAEILALNPDLDPRNLREGTPLKMPARGKKAPASAGGAKAAEAPAASGAAVPGEYYVVQRGDRLTTISKRAYKTIERWPDIWAKNLAIIKDPEQPPPGAKILLPR